MTSTLRLITRPPNTARPLLCASPDRGDKIGPLVLPGHLAELDDTSSENQSAPPGWAHIVHTTESGTQRSPGWIERIYLGAEFGREMDTFELGHFVAACCQTELTTRENNQVAPDTATRVILADYLIALAMIESDLENFDTPRPGTDSVGAFHLTSADWEKVKTGLEAQKINDADRFIHGIQILGAEYLTQQDWDELVAIARESHTAVNDAEDDEYVPSFLTLFHARLLGPQAAFTLNTINAEEARRNDDLLESLANVLEAEVLDELLASRRNFLDAAPPLSVNGFFNSTANLLGKKLTNAFSLYREHYPAFAKPPVINATPWMETAEEEMAFWAADDVTETSAKGIARIKDDYFHATSHHPDEVQPWCGAFVAWCLKNCESDVAAESVVEGAARAANWISWGTREIRPGSIKRMSDITGALVVLHPLAGTGSSGHVTFAKSRASGSDKIECIGGNQSDTVRVSSYDISRIAAVRVLEVTPPPPETDLGTPDVNDRFRTIYANRGKAYRTVVDWSHYNSTIVDDGEPRGNSRIWGDAPINAQSHCIQKLIDAAGALGMNADELAMVLAIARYESGFNPDAAAGTSSAQGLGQFIRKTGEFYGLTDSNRWNIAEQARALVEHTRDNFAAARARNLSDEWVYARHHDGSLDNRSGGRDLALEHIIPRRNEIRALL